MPTRLLRQVAFGLLLLFAGVSAANASSFQVNPVRAELSPGQPVVALTVRNIGSEPAVMQLEVMNWSQQEGQDIYSATKEILATPPIFTVPGGGSQIVRVGLRRAPDAHRELAYRLFLQEVPPPPKPGFQGLQVALRVGVPVFVAPAAVQPPALSWRANRTPDGRLEVGVTNNGNAHIQVASFKLALTGGKESAIQQAAAYVLPGQSRKWLVKAFLAPPPGATVHVSAQTDAGELDGGIVTVQ
jgi:fimbrial chaperone protein